MKAPNEVADVWQAEFEFAYERVPGGLLTLTMHPEVTGRGGRLRSLEQLLDAWTSFPGVAIVRLDEFVERWRAAHPRVG